MISNLAHLPPLDDIRDEQVMKIIRVVINQWDSKRETLNVNIIDHNDLCSTVEVDLFTVEDERVAGLLPSKCAITRTNDVVNIEMSFYSCSSIPQQARPFRDGPTYVCAFAVDSDCVVEYPVDIRMFIDHIITPDGVWYYVFVFGKDQYNDLVLDAKLKGDH